MTTAVQRRRGTATEHSSFTGLEGEISVNTTNESVHVHDGSTAGGFELMRADGSNSSIALGDISGVTAGTGLSGGGTSGDVTLNIDSTVATLAGTQTFTNKTLTSPILNTPTIGTSFTIGGATITEAELEILDGATLTTTELNYVDGVTSSIQTQIDAKSPLASPSFTGNITGAGNITLNGTGSAKVPSGTTAQRDSSPVDGMFRYNSTTDEFEGYSDGSWGSIGGGSSNLNIDTMTGDGSDTTLTLSIDPTVENNTQVYIDGVYQNKDTYSVSGTTLTFSTAPPTGSAVEVMTITPTTLNVAGDGTITPAKIASGDFYFDTDTLYVDATNNNVGIGTSSPTFSSGTYGGLHVHGSNGTSLRMTNAASGQTASDGYEILLDPTSKDTLYVNRESANQRFYTGGSERLRILSTGGITFNGDTAQANALDDYEEGTFTPMLSSNFTGTYAHRVGTYTKIGNMVHFSMFVALSSGGGSGSIVVEGLPFASGSGGQRYHAYQGWTNNFSANGYVQFLHGAGVDTLSLYKIVSAGASQASQVSDMGTSGNFILSGTYTTG